MTTPIYSPPLDDVTTAVLALLNGSGRKVWDGAYGGSPTSPAYPYGILYRLAGGSADPMPTLDLDLRTVTVPYQVTAVSNLRNQCEQAGRVLRDRLLARNATGWVYPLTLPAGWACIDRRPDPAMPAVDRVGDTPNAIFTQSQRFHLTIAPTA